jgi:hypothetical protein
MGRERKKEDERQREKLNNDTCIAEVGL